MAELGSEITGTKIRGPGIRLSVVRPFMLVLVILLLQHSCEAVYKEGGRSGKLPREDINGLTYQLITRFPIDEGTTYSPGLVQQIVVTARSGLRYLLQLVVLNGATCNMGMGSEGLSLPPGVVAGVALNEAFDDLYLAVDQLIAERNAWGYAIDEGVILAYFQLDDSTLNPNPDNSGRRKDELVEVLPETQNKSRNHTDDRPQRDLSPLFQPKSTVRYPVGVSPSFVARKINHKFTSAHSSSRSHYLKDTSLKLGDAGTYPWTKTEEGDCLMESELFTSSDDSVMSGALNILRPGWSLWSPSQMFRLIIQDDCNLVLYDTWRNNQPIWASGTNGRGSSCYVKIQLDGVFGVFDGDGTNYWYSPDTKCNSGNCWSTVTLQVQDDGNVVLYALSISSNSRIVLWSSDTVVCRGGCPITAVSYLASRSVSRVDFRSSKTSV